MLKSQKITNVDEGMEKLETLYTSGGILENSLTGCSSKCYIELLYNLVVLLLGLYPSEM